MTLANVFSGEYANMKLIKNRVSDFEEKGCISLEKLPTLSLWTLTLLYPSWSPAPLRTAGGHFSLWNMMFTLGCQVNPDTRQWDVLSCVCERAHARVFERVSMHVYIHSCTCRCLYSNCARWNQRLLPRLCECPSRGV